MAHRFVGLKDDGRKHTYLYEADRRTIVRQVLWGDHLTVKRELDDGWLEIDWAPKSPTKRRTLYIHRDDTVEERPLEIIFVDVGQGDGAVLITPEKDDDERIIVIDAGESDNMRAFLSARFKTYRGFDFSAAIITHPDKDHYLGFQSIFENPAIGFETIYHNGLVEWPVAGDWKIGTPRKDPASGVSYIHELAVDRAAVERDFSDAAANGRSLFPRLMKAALDNPKIGDIRMLSVRHGEVADGRTWMPGFSPADGRGYTVQVLGPVVEDTANGPGLRRLGDPGETKNGHSVLLKLRHGSFSVLFGGDLNAPAEKFLLTHYTGRERFPRVGSDDYGRMIEGARAVFQADVMKSCHHGSEKVTDAFLAAVHPAAFVVSSGDEEGHVHPRPDLLGRLGKHGRGDAPVILSTELQRSTRTREDGKLLERLLADIDRLAADPTDAVAARAKDAAKELAKTNVEVYGAIYMKTDGERLIIAFRIEEPSEKKKWFYFCYTVDQAGVLVRH